jgi:hypothetical protein
LGSRRITTRRLGQLPDNALLEMRVRHLPVSLGRTPTAKRIRQVFAELRRRGIAHQPHVWLSSEWFSPDGVPGFAVPFYLAHPRLMKLEQKMMLEVEGGAEREGLKIIRHEVGHAICTAYRLHYRREWRSIFGLYSRPYPITYRPDPFSRRFVLHFNAWYAQAHPAEDFAETFAVWLRWPAAAWRKQYAGWPALRKLEYVDRLMNDLRGVLPPVRNRRVIEPLSINPLTLREHYRRKRRRYAEDWPDFYDRDLRRIFSDDARHENRETAASFLRRVSPAVRPVVADWTGTHQYTIDQVLIDMIDRCRELKLRLAVPVREAQSQVTLMLTVQTLNFLHEGRHHFAI